MKIKPANCTCKYPDEIYRNLSGHHSFCPCHLQIIKEREEAREKPKTKSDITTAGVRCFCPGCVRELPLDNEGCKYCDFTMDYQEREHIPTLEQLLNYDDHRSYNDISPRFFKFLVAYGRATPHEN
jgi:hypothetical protein